jgi:hypothetical protein
MDSPITPITAQEVQQDFQDVRREHYVRRCLIAFDIMCNVVFFNGDEDETISSHSARAATQGKRWGIALSWFLDLFQRDHGAHAVAGDECRALDIEKVEENSGVIPPKES